MYIKYLLTTAVECRRKKKVEMEWSTCKKLQKMEILKLNTDISVKASTQEHVLVLCTMGRNRKI